MFYEDFINYIPIKYPYLKDVIKNNPPSPYLFSNHPVTIELQDFDKIKSFINAIYKLRNNVNYQKDLLGRMPNTNQYSILMSFDFHITNEGPKLIEINTNASHFLTSYYWVDFLTQKLQIKTICNNPEQNPIDQLLASFQKEMSLFQSNKTIQTIAIVDEDPTHQKAYSEFLMYREWLTAQGYDVIVCDVQDLFFDATKKQLFAKNMAIDFVYNRHIDFFLEKENSKNLKEAFIKHAACVSPQPDEYLLLADKFRLTDFSNTHFLEKYLDSSDTNTIKECLLDTFEVNKKDKDELWQNRKKYFFKPMNSYGSKGVYDGAKITHSTFDQIFVTKVYLAQEVARPKQLQLEVANKIQDVKYDLRFYVYAGNLQHAIARTYIGQTTNFQTLGCGFSPISLK